MANKLVAMYGWKYEPEWLVEEMKQNADFVDEFVCHDCRDRNELWMNEGEHRRILVEMAWQVQADWVMYISPDERYEKGAGYRIRSLIDTHKNPILYEFALREMYSPTQYRVDGIWGAKNRLRIFPLLPHQQFDDKPIQCSGFPKNMDYFTQHIDLNIYHLKMIEPENRRLRTQVFKKLDPTNQYQNIGYDYLDDETGMVLETIPKGREYSPPYRKYLFQVPPRYLCE